jgi:hypothetical protein
MERKTIFIILLTTLLLSLAVLSFDVLDFQYYAAQQRKPVSIENVVVFTPQLNEKIASPYKISGLARGKWFFEASFPIILRDELGNEMSMAIASAMSDWMTQDFVPFEAEIRFSVPATKTGTLIFKKDNPSGLPENDDEIQIPVTF